MVLSQDSKLYNYKFTTACNSKILLSSSIRKQLLGKASLPPFNPQGGSLLLSQTVVAKESSNISNSKFNPRPPLNCPAPQESFANSILKAIHSYITQIIYLRIIQNKTKNKNN